jgi:hypothetical protein
MTNDLKTEPARDDSPTGYGRQVRGSRKGLGGDPPNGVSRRRVELPRPRVQGTLANDVIPKCALCHTSTAAVTVQTLYEGAYWRCTRCGQMWDALRLQTAADYARHAELLPLGA